jgi:predicted aspartyl protease
MKPLRTLITTLTLSVALTFTYAADDAKDAPKAPTKDATKEPAKDAGKDTTSVFRRYSTRAGATFYAQVTGKNDLAVNFKLQDGRLTVMPIRDLSQPDQQFVRKWTKFKDDLMNNAQFSKLSIKEMLEMRGYQSFEFDIEGNHIFVEGEMNGKQTRFLIDTGADTSLLHIGAAKDAGVEVGPMDQVISGIAGTQPAAVCTVASIKLGDAKIENRKLLAADLFKDQGGKGNFDAIFGADFLSELDAVISYREGRMFLKPDNIKTPGKAPVTGIPGTGDSPALYAELRRWTTSEQKSFTAQLIDKTDKDVTFKMNDGKLAPWPIDKLSEADQAIVAKWDKLKDVLSKNPEWKRLTVKELLELRSYQSFAYRKAGNHILVDGTVAGVKANFLIDTGAYSGVLHIEFSKRAKLKIGPMDQVISGIGGNAPAALTEIPKLTMGDATIENRTLLSADLFKDRTANGDRGDFDAIFGADFLRELDGVISYKEARIFLRPDVADKKGDAAKPEGEKPDEGGKPTEAPKPVDKPKPGTPTVPAPTTPAKPTNSAQAAELAPTVG